MNGGMACLRTRKVQKGARPSSTLGSGLRGLVPTFPFLLLDFFILSSRIEPMLLLTSSDNVTRCLVSELHKYGIHKFHCHSSASNDRLPRLSSKLCTWSSINPTGRLRPSLYLANPDCSGFGAQQINRPKPRN